MKRLLLLFTLAFVAMSCEEIQDLIDPKGHGLVFLEGEMKAYFDDKGDTKNYKFKADLAWSAEVSADWVEVDPTSGPAGENKIKIKVDKNKSDEKRTGYVDITLSNDKSYRIELEQLAAGENLDDVTPSTTIPNNEIWYTNGSTTEPTAPNKTNVFGVNIVSNTYNAEKECWIIKFDGDVTTIGNYAFEDCSSLTSVTIPDGVTTIGYMAFYDCSSLTNVTISNSVTTIGERAFYNCSSLTSVTIPDSVTTIGDSAFFSCWSLTSVTIGDSVTTIGGSAFSNCSSLREFNGKFASEDGRCLISDGTLNSFAPAGLTEYTIPDSVTTIGEAAFYKCRSLASVTIPDSVTTIGYCAFYNCSSLTSVTIPDSVTTIGGGAFRDCSSLTSVTIGDSVTEIGGSAFRDCSGLTSVTIPDSVTTIGGGAFQGCRSLTSVTIPDSVTEIGHDAFAGCENLEAVHITDLVSWCNIDFINPFTDGSVDLGANPLCNAHNLYLNGELVTDLVIPDGVNEIKLMAFALCESIKSVTIPNSVTTIGDYAFDRCYSLTSVTIGDSVTEIGYCTFYDCTSLESVTIGDSVTTIGKSAFCDCSSLTSVTIGDSVTTIGDWAFEDCSSLTSVTIPDSVTTIGLAAFSGCTSLTSVYCKATIPPTAILYDNGNWYTFDENTSGRIIYVPTESVEVYKSATGWSDYADDIVGYNF